MKFASDQSGSVPWVQGGFKTELGLSLDKELVKNLILVAGGLELGGGLLIAFGFEAYGAALLATFLVAVTPVLHNPAHKTGKDLQETQVRDSMCSCYPSSVCCCPLFAHALLLFR